MRYLVAVAAALAALAALAGLAAILTFSATGHGSSSSVSPTQVLASLRAAQAAGTAVEVHGCQVASGPSGTTFYEVAPGLTLRQAVGLDPIPPATMAAMQAKAVAARGGCRRLGRRVPAPTTK